MDKVKILDGVLSMIASCCLLLIFLITSIQLVVGMGNGYFRKEYEKYQIPEQISVSMENLLQVTEEMMAYLEGKRENLEIETVIAGQKKEFFNEIEKLHMEDVRILFQRGIALRRMAVVLLLLCCGIFVLRKKPWLDIILRVYRFLFPIICIFWGAAAGIISANFTEYFIVFHRLLFENEYWWLDPKTSLLVNLVPEPFFIDTAVRILILFLSFSGSIFVISIMTKKRKSIWKRKQGLLIDREQI